jgi:hypothetical protein
VKKIVKDMNTANLKIDLINKITQVKDSNIIKEINRVLDFELNEGIFKLNPAQRKRIAEAKVEIRQKKVLSNAAANKEISEWLDK